MLADCQRFAVIMSDPIRRADCTFIGSRAILLPQRQLLPTFASLWTCQHTAAAAASAGLRSGAHSGAAGRKTGCAAARYSVESWTRPAP